ncbi:MAG: diguanylate cyclase, partial [Dehalococcoidales bacterium]
MNIYALFPLVAIIAYVPLLINTLSGRTWQRQRKLFAIFLVAAILFGVADLLLRSDVLQQHNFLLARIAIILYSLMGLQFHLFTSSFFPAGTGRWLPFAYASLAVLVIVTALGYLPRDIIASGSKVSVVYGPGVFFLIVPGLILLSRNVYVLGKVLKSQDNPVLFNQAFSLVLTLFVLAIFSFASLLPWGREFPIIHFGTIINALILSYATIRHNLVDIKFVLQRGSTLVTLVVIAIASYWLLLAFLDTTFNLGLDLTAMFIATSIAAVIIVLVQKLRGFFFRTMGKVFHGEIYGHRRELSDFASKIHTVFSLTQQGGELLKLVTKATGCKRAYLLFPEPGTADFTTQFVDPGPEGSALPGLRLGEHNPIVEFLQRERKLLTSQNLASLPGYQDMEEPERQEIESNGTELYLPLISRDKLIGILGLDQKQYGRYSVEEYTLLEDATDRVAVSMEKEYLREQLREREEELSVLNRSSAIITSTLDIRGTYDSFIDEIRKVIDISWTAVVLTGDKDAYFLALSSEIGSVWQPGERIPLKSTAVEWVVNYKKPMVESDLSPGNNLVTTEALIQKGVRSIAYLPLIAKGKAIGSLIAASRSPNAYNQRQITLLEQLASQIAMHVENSRLYAEVEEKAHIDELTGLFNRRSLDEVIASETSRHSRYGGIFSLIILDIDSLKSVNDTHGHLAGDELLRKIGGALKTSIRDADQAFRYGGDEFAIVLPNTPIDAASRVAGRIRKQIASKMKVGDISVTASLGLANWPADGLTTNELIAAADAALYQAKRAGGNRSHNASGSMLPLDDVTIGPGDGQDNEALNTIYALAATVSARNDYNSSHWRKVKEFS